MQEHYSTKYGNWKSETLVRNILQNEVYIGRVTFGGVSYPGKHRPIVSEQLFYHVQDMLKERQQRSPQNTQTISNAQSTPNTAKRPFQASTLLSGLLYCKKCGARYHGEHGNYTCYSRSKGDKKYIRNPACKNRKWKIAELDALVTDILCRLDFEALELSPLNMFSLDTALSGTDTSCRFPAKEDYQERITAIESEQKNLEEQTSRLLNLYQLGTISFDMISAKAEEVQGEKDRLDKEAKTLAKWADSKISETSDLFIPYDRDYNLSAAKQLHHLLTSASLPERRTCVQLLIYKIILDEENVEILLNDII
ncbi:MAG: recombinase family protein [Clostridiales bacterium]|nr:recombinase family protein [Clostridiales bacterium]